MKINKLSFAVLAAAGLLALSIPAQAADTNTPAAPTTPPAGGPPGMRGPRMSVEQRLTQLSESLKLTDDQKPKVKALLDEQQKQMADLRQAAPEDRRTKMQALREEMNTKMKDILTPEQYETYSKMAPPGGRRGGNGGPGADTNAPAAKP